MKICLACSAGGHLTEIKELENIYKKYNYFFLTFKRQDSISLCNREKIYFITCPQRNLRKFANNFFESIRVFKKELPDVIITTGADVALCMCFIAKLFKKKVIFIESFARVIQPSLFGKLVYPIADLTIVQWIPLLKYYKKAKYGGPIFNFSGDDVDKNKIKNQIFVTVGTHISGFVRLLKETDDLIERGLIKEKVIGQIGNSKYEPKNYNWFRFTSKEDYWDTLKRSKIVITHGGIGSISNALKFNKKTIIVPRRKKFGEHIDDHQLDIAKEFEKQGKIIAVYDINDLKEALEQVKKLKIPMDKKESDVAKIIGDYLGR